MNEKEAREVFDGLMLSDGSLVRRGRSVYYRMGQSKHAIPIEDHLKWEYWLRDNVFTALGVKASVKSSWWTRVTGQRYQVAELWTENSPLFIPIYDGWYAGGGWITPKRRSGSPHMRGATKQLPCHIMEISVLPALTVAEWFLGDGGSSWDRKSIDVSLSTQCFTREEVYHLIDVLENMGINTIKPHQDQTIKGSGLKIKLAQDSVDNFMDLVEPHILEVFGDSVGPSYKDIIKYRSGYSRNLELGRLRKLIGK